MNVESGYYCFKLTVQNGIHKGSGKNRKMYPTKIKLNENWWRPKEKHESR